MTRVNRPHVPAGILRAAVLVGLQGAALLVVAGVLVVRAVDGAGPSPGLGFGLAGWFAAFGAALVAAGVALGRGRRGGRGPATIAQLLFLPVAFYLLTAAQVAAGLALGALVGVTLSQLYSAASAAWMEAQYVPLPEDEGPAPTR